MFMFNWGDLKCIAPRRPEADGAALVVGGVYVLVVPMCVCVRPENPRRKRGQDTGLHPSQAVAMAIGVRLSSSRKDDTN